MKVPNLILVPLTNEYRVFPRPLIRCWQYYVLWNFNSSFIANCFP